MAKKKTTADKLAENMHELYSEKGSWASPEMNAALRSAIETLEAKFAEDKKKQTAEALRAKREAKYYGQGAVPPPNMSAGWGGKPRNTGPFSPSAQYVNQYAAQYNKKYHQAEIPEYDEVEIRENSDGYWEISSNTSSDARVLCSVESLQLLIDSHNALLDRIKELCTNPPDNLASEVLEALAVA